MQPLHDESSFEWIVEIRDRISLEKPRPDPNWTGIFISDLIPPQYEAYAQILGRFDARYDDIDNPLSPSEQKVLGIPDCEPLKSFILKRRGTSPTPRIRWKEMAALLDLPYVPEINFGWFRRRMNGWCVSRLINLFTGEWPGSEECEELISILTMFTASEECFFRMPSEYVYQPRLQPMLYTGRLSEASAFLQARHTVFEYWWPPDRRWCFCWDSDVGATIIGGPKDLISMLLANPVLECIETTLDTRVDSEVPIPK
jgi:hypothetical protein